MKEHRLDCLATVTGFRPAILATLSQIPHLTVPAGFARVVKEGGDLVCGSTVPLGISFLGRPWSERLLLEIGFAFERATACRREPPYYEPQDANLDAFDISQFNRLKKKVAMASYQTLELGENGYLHPNPEEFRRIVETVKRNHAPAIVA